MTIGEGTGRIAVTGASGLLGSKLAFRLAAAGAQQRLVVRDAARAPRLPDGDPLPDTDVAVVRGYEDAPAMVEAFSGTQTVVLVSAREDAQRVAQHRAAVDAAVAAGVEQIVYVSFVGADPDATFTFARDHWHTEVYVQATGLRHTFLRDNLYHRALALMVGPDGVLRGPGGDGRVASVSHDDVADVATAVLLDDDPGRHDGVAYDVTGPEAISLAEVAELLSAATGRRITYYPETLDEAYRSRAGFGASAFEVDGWVSSYTSIAAGELAHVSDVVERFTQRRGQSFSEWLDDYPDEWAHLRG
ncbi:NmrA family NAD(P)-binding protein [Cellulosimicrobium arenosum]|uniref:NmrA family NAD(P)-binding protein n=1 Tax=Cellulosimicrobium arenosum TaxID=2708133 RepID=A0A927J187_9MICO|nr:NmrA family NAD(P)-binding protein [Cellulosimicrobium arenosum]MBD8080036.1 NmrA family NAD(P)-binding protein [Cellulosimicrobium arenosum]